MVVEMLVKVIKNGQAEKDPSMEVDAVGDIDIPGDVTGWLTVFVVLRGVAQSGR